MKRGISENPLNAASSFFSAQPNCPVLGGTLHLLHCAIITFLHVCELHKGRVQVLVIFIFSSAQHSVPITQQVFKNAVWLDLNGNLCEVLCGHSKGNTTNLARGKTGEQW